MSETPEYVKHTTHTDALDTLGTVITDAEKRDAIHLAVFPAMAGHAMNPGQHVVLVDGKRALACPAGEGVGIVDPFLRQSIREGDLFWLVVYPREISSLRHVWEHPAFPASGETDAPPFPPKADAERWLRDFAAAEYIDFDDLIESCKNGSQDGEYVKIDGSDANGAIPDEFWTKLGIYLNKSFTGFERGKYFTCSC